MPYQSASLERVYILRWGRSVLASDIEPIVAEMVKLCKQHGPIVGIALMPPDLSPPDGEMRKLIGQNMRAALDASESLHYVIEGTGFKSSIMRSVVTNVLMLTGQRGRISVHGTLDEVVAHIEGRLVELGLTKNQIVQLVKARGMFTSSPSSKAGLSTPPSLGR